MCYIAMTYRWRVNSKRSKNGWIKPRPVFVDKRRTSVRIEVELWFYLRHSRREGDGAPLWLQLRSEAPIIVVKLRAAGLCDALSSRSPSASWSSKRLMKHRRIDIFGHQTALLLEVEYWDRIGELRAKTGASLRDVVRLYSQ